MGEVDSGKRLLSSSEGVGPIDISPVLESSMCGDLNKCLWLLFPALFCMLWGGLARCIPCVKHDTFQLLPKAKLGHRAVGSDLGMNLREISNTPHV